MVALGAWGLGQSNSFGLDAACVCLFPLCLSLVNLIEFLREGGFKGGMEPNVP